MDKQPTPRRRASRAAARTLATAAAVAALVTTLGAGQALAGPDERVLERQGKVNHELSVGQADEQGKAGEPSQAPSAQYPRRYLRPEPPMDTSPRLNSDAFAPAPAPPAQDRDRDGLAITLAVVALLLAVGAATTWRIYRRPRPEPTA